MSKDTAPFTDTIMVCFAGASQSGKNEQIRRIFNYQDSDGTYPFRPCLALVVEASADRKSVV